MTAAKGFYQVETFTGCRAIGYLVRRLNTLLMPHAEALFADAELSFSQWVILMALRDGEAASAPDQRVEAGQVLPVPAVVLRGKPGGIDGLVRLDPLFGTPALLGMVSIRVRALGEGAPDAEIAAQTPTPLVDDALRGAFAFDDEAERARVEVETKMTAARGEGNAARTALHAQAMKEESEILAKAREEAEAITSKGRSANASARDTAKAALDAQAKELAALVATRALGREVGR